MSGSNVLDSNDLDEDIRDRPVTGLMELARHGDAEAWASFCRSIETI